MADITKQDIHEALAYPKDFGYSGDNDEMFIVWSLGSIIRTRDSNILEMSNANALEKALDKTASEGKFSENDYEITQCNHWAVGWVEHLSFRAIESEEIREPTAIFHWLKEWFDALADYPIADEADWNERTYKYALKALDDMRFCVTTSRENMNNFDYRSEEPDNWKNQVLDRMTEHPTEKCWHEDEAMHIAFNLKFLACDGCDGDGWVYDWNAKIPIPLDPNGNIYAKQGFTHAKINCELCNGTGVNQGNFTQEEIDTINTHVNQTRGTT